MTTQYIVVDIFTEVCLIKTAVLSGVHACVTGLRGVTGHFICHVVVCAAALGDTSLACACSVLVACSKCLVLHAARVLVQRPS